eukprot:CAMPEP_0194195376 /NCGR_PEP_ID=MMETSP0154-20130528/76104_1 /TAXON_ID=1049557 /ORGANISM="Thalassiothrix antarctica, Strain L6-D1" /LENGTH=520 /DNA_ID=CAMNT_0038919903 /DNA_START=21 /DNA_END=1580 /DNA_ORIENTATION=-
MSLQNNNNLNNNKNLEESKPKFVFKAGVTTATKNTTRSLQDFLTSLQGITTNRPPWNFLLQAYINQNLNQLLDIIPKERIPNDRPHPDIALLVHFLFDTFHAECIYKISITREHDIELYSISSDSNITKSDTNDDGSTSATRNDNTTPEKMTETTFTAKTTRFRSATRNDNTTPEKMTATTFTARTTRSRRKPAYFKPASKTEKTPTKKSPKTKETSFKTKKTTLKTKITSPSKAKITAPSDTDDDVFTFAPSPGIIPLNNNDNGEGNNKSAVTIATRNDNTTPEKMTAATFIAKTTRSRRKPAYFKPASKTEKTPTKKSPKTKETSFKTKKTTLKTKITSPSKAKITAPSDTDDDVFTFAPSPGIIPLNNNDNGEKNNKSAVTITMRNDNTTPEKMSATIFTPMTTRSRRNQALQTKKTPTKETSKIKKTSPSKTKKTSSSKTKKTAVATTSTTTTNTPTIDERTPREQQIDALSSYTPSQGTIQRRNRLQMIGQLAWCPEDNTPKSLRKTSKGGYLAT